MLSPSRALRSFALAASLSVAPVVAEAQSPLSDSHRQAVIELLRASQMDRMIDQSRVTMIDAMLGQAPPELRQVFDRFFAEYFSWSRLEEQYVALYGAAFTEAEARELSAFYATPVGVKFVAASPELMKRGAEIGQRQVEAHLPELERMIQEATARKPGL
jgi:hypothetical protein